MSPDATKEEEEESEKSPSTTILEILEDDKKKAEKPECASEPDLGSGQCPELGAEGQPVEPEQERDAPEFPDFEDSAQTDDDSAEASLIDID